ncbi:MAG: sulfatase-like hydrolase/transferase [Planctomycetota bacterium]|jgi:uncharacterized sulfatase
MGDRPNLLIVHTDQQSSWTLGAYGGELVGTPHIDRIGSEGAVFDNFFTNSALCTPSRGCMLTGRYPNCHGAWENNYEFRDDEVTLAEVLAAAGYETGYAGKWHLGGEPRPGWMQPERSRGFADCRWMFNRGHWKSVAGGDGDRPDLLAELGKGQYTTDWLGDRTLEFLRHPRSRPFFHMVSFPDPHTPFNVREPYASMYDPADMPVPATFDQDDLPSWAEAVRQMCLSQAARDEMDPAQWLRRRKAAYCGEVKCIDDNVGRILTCLDELGILDETIVLFTTDHGEYMGEHGIYYKNYVYETAYRIPLLVRWPGRIPAGARVERFVTTVDFQQTILSLMGVAPSGREQGRDATVLLGRGGDDWRDEAFFHHNRFDFAGIFTGAYELGLARCGEHVLFDRVNDPEQVRNLIGDPAHRGALDELAGRVLEHNRQIDSPAMEWLADWRKGPDGEGIRPTCNG